MDASAIDFSGDLPDLPAGFEPDTSPDSSDSSSATDTAQPDPSSQHIQFVMNDLEGGGKLTTDNNGAKVRYGINQAANPDVDLTKLTPDSAESIYRDRYWNKINGDKLAPEMQLPAISFAANAGTNQANKLIAASGGDVNKFMDLQKGFYQNLGQTPKYAPQLSGWMDRLAKVQKANQQYASADSGTQTDAQYDNSDNGPALPDGFELDQPAASAATTSPDAGLPAGFELDAPSAQPEVPFYGGADSTTPTQQAPAAPADNSFVGREKQDWANRNQQLQDINQADVKGGQPISSTMFQTAGDLAGRGVDLGGNILGSLGRYVNDYAPELGGSLKDIWNEAKGDAAQAANPALGDVSDYVKSKPELARNISAANDIAMAAPFAKPAAEAIGAVDSGISNVSRSIGASGADAAPTAADLRGLANQAYTDAETKGGVLNADFTNNFLDKLEGLTPQTEAGKIAAGNSPFTQIVDRLAGKVDPDTGERVGGLRNKPITLAGAQEVDEALGDEIDSNIDKTTGRPTKQGKKLMDVQTAFRQSIDAAGPDDIVGNNKDGFDALKLGRARWAQAASMNDLERVANRALLMDNPQTGFKVGMRQLATNPNRLKGFTLPERALINDASKTGLAADAMRVLGSRLNPIAALAAHGPAGAAAAQLVATVGRKAATEMGMGKWQKVVDAVAARKMPTPSAPFERPPVPPAAPQLRLPPPAIITPSPNAYEASTADAQKEQMWSGRQAALANQEKLNKAAAEKAAAAEIMRSQLAESIKAAKDHADAKSEPLPMMAQAMKDAGFKKGGLITHKQWVIYLQKHGKKNGHTMKDKNDPEVQKTALKMLQG